MPVLIDRTQETPNASDLFKSLPDTMIGVDDLNVTMDLPQMNGSLFPVSPLLTSRSPDIFTLPNNSVDQQNSISFVPPTPPLKGRLNILCKSALSNGNTGNTKKKKHCKNALSVDWANLKHVLENQQTNKTISMLDHAQTARNNDCVEST